MGAGHRADSVRWALCWVRGRFSADCRQHVKAIVCTRYGPPEVLQLENVARPTPNKNEVCIRVLATAVTSSDCYIRGLNLPLGYRVLARLALGVTAPRRRILGMVLAGEVDSVGRDVRSFKEGDQVFGLDRYRFGTYAEYVCWPHDGVLAARPANLTYEEAAAVPYGGLLALHYLKRANIRSGQRVLIFGASGAVGTSAVQLAVYFGAEVTGVCSAANLELVESLGAAMVIDYTTEDFTKRGEFYDVIFDAVGRRKSSKALQQSKRALTPTGTCMSVDDGRPKMLTENLVLLKHLAETAKIRPVIDRCYPLEQIAEAHRYVDTGHKRGNVVVTVGRQDSTSDC
jgi:NADPH:quinone reductase-like Zn-dependent oxidoreductase